MGSGVLASKGLTNAKSVLKLLRYLSSYSSVLALSLMTITPQDIAQRAGEEAKNILGALPGLAADGAAKYVKDGTPSGPIPNLGVALARQACRRYADNPGGVPGSVAAGFERVCRPYLDGIGYGEPVAIGRPFDGGQCAAVYLVSFSFGSSLSGPNNGQARMLGPVGGGRLVDTVNGGKDFEIFSSGWAQGFTGCGPVANGGPAWRRIGGMGGGATGYFGRVTSIVPCGADNCGNLPTVVTQPKPPTTPGPVREPFSPSPNTRVDIDVTIGPSGDITFNIGGGPVTIDPFGGGGDGGGGEPGTSPGSGLPPGDIGSPAQPVATSAGGSASGCAPANSVLVGIKVDILMAPAFSSEYDPLVRRGVCYAYMGTLGNLALDPSGVALRSGQMLFAPLDNLTCWEVRANTGYILRVTPYYRSLEAAEV